MLGRIEKLEQRIQMLEARLAPAPAAAPSLPAAPTAPAIASAPESSNAPVAVVQAGTTLSATFDGFYEYNFNRPVGRTNLLRAYDALSNNFSINQASILLERAPDVAAGRRFGGRIDLMFGQATDTLQGSSVNEPRPQIYRNIWQAYGTYVVPLGSGLTVDFGKFSSALGIEGNYTKDQINYTRSYYFNYLPYYHMGFRANYDVNKKLNVAYWLVNGANQTEDFNGFKSQALLLTVKPNDKLTWNVNYYSGQEGRDASPNLNPGIPLLPTQPGLPANPLTPVPDGRTHILDTYASWTATPKLTLAAEADYVVSRNFAHDAPSHVGGAAGYLRYQMASKFAVGSRFEYLSDRGGLFSGVNQALKEFTLTGIFPLADGLQMRWEYRRDFSNRPFCLTDNPLVRKRDQNTALLGLTWWFGGKTGSW